MYSFVSWLSTVTRIYSFVSCSSGSPILKPALVLSYPHQSSCKLWYKFVRNLGFCNQLVRLVLNKVLFLAVECGCQMGAAEQRWKRCLLYLYTSYNKIMKWGTRLCTPYLLWSAFYWGHSIFIFIPLFAVVIFLIWWGHFFMKDTLFLEVFWWERKLRTKILNSVVNISFEI